MDLLNSKSLDIAREYFELAREYGFKIFWQKFNLKYLFTLTTFFPQIIFNRLCPTAFTYLVGTKADEVDKFAYKLPDLSKFASDLGAMAFRATSAKTGLGITEIFEEICNKIKAL